MPVQKSISSKNMRNSISLVFQHYSTADRHCKPEPVFYIVVVNKELSPTGRMWRCEHRCITLMKTLLIQMNMLTCHAVTSEQHVLS